MDPSSSFTLQELQQLLLTELRDPAAAAKAQWALAPFEYLARRKGQAQLVVGSVAVSDLLPHTPFVLEYCRKLIIDSSSPATAREAARKAATFTSRLLAVLSIAGVQHRLGGQQQLQPYLLMLREALPTFQHQAGGPHKGAPASSADQLRAAHLAAAAAVAAAEACPEAQLPPEDHTPFAGAAGSASAAAAGPHAGSGAGVTTPSSSMHLAALLAAIAPYASQPGGPLPPHLPALLHQWARLVYGEAGVAHPRSVQVSALLQHHWRTLLRFLRLCLQGAASLAGSSGAGGPMTVSAAVGHVQGLLHLLQQDPLRALFTPQQYRRVTERLLAIATVLQGLPQTPSGHAAAVTGFSSSAVAALLEASSTYDSAGLPAACTAPMVSASMGAGGSGVSTAGLMHELGMSSELSVSQQQLLSLVKSQLQQAGALSPSQLDAVRDVLDVLRRQVGGSERYKSTLLPE